MIGIDFITGSAEADAVDDKSSRLTTAGVTAQRVEFELP